MAAEAALGAQLREAEVEPGLADRLAAYGALLLDATRSMNLTAARTPEALALHLLDALTLVPFARGPLIDIGAGGGLPGIPLALATGHHVALVESSAKKAGFLERAAAALGLDAEVWGARAEALGHEPRLRGRFSTATARAVGPASTVAELTLPFLTVGGVALLQRGAVDPAERNALPDALSMLGGVLRDERRIEGERRILIVEKIGETPARFPRRTGIPAKRPLCYG